MERLGSWCSLFAQKYPVSFRSGWDRFVQEQQGRTPPTRARVVKGWLIWPLRGKLCQESGFGVMSLSSVARFVVEQLHLSLDIMDLIGERFLTLFRRCPETTSQDQRNDRIKIR